MVVGVAGDVRSRALGEAPAPEFYLPIDQVPAEGWDWVQRTVFIVVRTDLDPQAMANPIRDVVRTVAPGVPVFQVSTMDAAAAGLDRDGALQHDAADAARARRARRSPPSASTA